MELDTIEGVIRAHIVREPVHRVLLEYISASVQLLFVMRARGVLNYVFIICYLGLIVK